MSSVYNRALFQKKAARNNLNNMAGILASSQPLINAAFNNEDDSMRAIPKRMTGQGIGALKEVPMIVGQPMPPVQMQQAPEPQPMSPTPNFDAMNNLPQQNFLAGGLASLGASGLPIIFQGVRSSLPVVSRAISRGTKKASPRFRFKRNKDIEDAELLGYFLKGPKQTTGASFSRHMFPRKNVTPGKTPQVPAKIPQVKRPGLTAALTIGTAAATPYIYNLIFGSGSELSDQDLSGLLTQEMPTEQELQTTEGQARAQEIKNLMLLAGISSPGSMGERAATNVASALTLEQVAQQEKEKNIEDTFNQFLKTISTQDPDLQNATNRARQMIQQSYAADPNALVGTRFQPTQQDSIFKFKQSLNAVIATSQDKANDITRTILSQIQEGVIPISSDQDVSKVVNLTKQLVGDSLKESEYNKIKNNLNRFLKLQQKNKNRMV